MRQYQKRQPAVKPRRKRPPLDLSTPRSNAGWRVLQRLGEERHEGRWTSSDAAISVFLHLVSRAETRLERELLLTLGADLFGYEKEEALAAVEVVLLETAVRS